MPVTRRFTWIVGRFGQSRHCSSLLIMLALSSFAAKVWAQEYSTLPINEKVGISNRATAQQCLRDAAAYATSKAKFDEYFTEYYFPSMTRTEPDKLGGLGKLRDDFFKQFLWKTTNSQLQHDLTDLTFAEMKTIVLKQDPPCHPAASYNAILIIGMLDDQYSPDGRQPPKPSASANKVLTIVVDSATTNNRFPPAVILGALIGLERHAQFRESLPPEAVTAMSAALLKLVTNDTPIQEMDRDAYSWMRLRAASALARLGSVGDKNAINNAIVKLAASGKSLDDRCEAAALLERLNYKDVKLDDAGTAEPLFALARDVAAAEDKRAQEFQDQGSTGSVGRAFPGGPGDFAPGGGTGTLETFPRRHVLSRLTDLRTGLKTVKPSLPAETQKKADAVLAALNAAITAAANKDTVELRLAEAIRTMAESINAAVPGAEKPADDKSKENAVF